ncbi:MAG: hypothetical protein A3J48_02685 [Candidatus Doudnabacteria bacterium RIFCSPHIGHO2_02_FULL_46_11]|uniref:CDP-diacylglycerol--glycerol-3-phosphate 3-phosphatidyltransferase n=1 Tax=Candidatus Doudnabacteria bacterium RIFCSPHIGHO2_02_FULL_46_11 TaxID=1817832 RepID=A0A1F5P8U1_9BACT|nr:MAG: hypothetical protein A3J48_02685 [Candidatus Doudnabacteria bacterium RIFCSPHIGHO2_02_FULL_46_11]
MLGLLVASYNIWVNFQKYTDKFIAKLVLPFVPHRISPNQVTWARIFSIPFIYYFLVQENYIWGFILFSIAALTDALDGAMARTRNKVTERGKVLDAVADRGLILLVAVIFIPKLFGWNLLIYLALLEALNASMAWRAKKKIKINPGANWAGKIKMIIQCTAFTAIFISLFSSWVLWLDLALFLLYISLIFTFIQAFVYPKTYEEARYA